MKLNKRILPLALSAVLGGLLSACSSGVSDDGVLPPPIVALEGAKYQIVLKDAIDGTLISDELELTFVGDPALVDAMSQPLNGKSKTTTSGLMAVNATFTPTAKEFSVQVADKKNKGWVATGTRIVGVVGVKDQQIIEIKLMNVNKAASVNSSTQAIAMAVGTAPAVGGKFGAPVELVTQPKTVTNADGVPQTIGVASLAIGTGTVATTADGKPAADGPLTISSTYFSNAQASAMSAFPGGFATTADVNGSSQSGAFITGGFAQFNITDSAGNPIKNFDPPVTIGIDLPKGTKDLATGNVLVPGDKFPVWSYDDATGKWVFEGDGLVQEKNPVDASNYTVKFTTSHLSSWNLDFLDTSACTARVNLTGRPAGDARPLQVELTGEPGFAFSKTVTVTDSELTFFYAPRSPVKVTVRDRGTVVVNGGSPVRNVQLCGGTVNIALSLAPIQTGTVEVNTSESCPDGKEKRNLPTFVMLNPASVDMRFGYTVAVPNTTVARVNFDSVLTGSHEIWAWNTRGAKYEIQPVTVQNGKTASVSFNFNNVTCTTGATGGTGGTGGSN